jgi:hypothetical protein
VVSFNTNKILVSAKSHKKESNKLAKTTTNKPEASVQNGNGSKISLNDDVTIVDEFGFIGKSSFHVKKVSVKSYKCLHTVGI